MRGTVSRELRKEAERLAAYEYAGSGFTADMIYKQLKKLWKVKSR